MGSSRDSLSLDGPVAHVVLDRPEARNAFDAEMVRELHEAVGAASVRGLLLVSCALGAVAVLLTPREEEPQIVVPMADVYVSFPGASAEEVERLVFATALEKLLWQVDGVEHVYSISRRDGAVVTVRFFVGEHRERAIVRLQSRIDAHRDEAPPGVAGWIMRPVEIDDISEILRFPGQFVWIGLHEPSEAVLRKIQEEFGLHDLAVEDALRAHQRPKVEEYGESMFVVLRTAQLSGETIEFGETHLFVGPRYLLSVRHGRTARTARTERFIFPPDPYFTTCLEKWG